ncbi:MAG: M1 family metallopeptidase [Deltaproteobacteria bacterium]|nr:M1 family metallopeptidase [Deltaproteobacteria bacterium]
MTKRITFCLFLAAALAAACSKSKPGQPASGGAPALSGAARDGGPAPDGAAGFPIAGAGPAVSGALAPLMASLRAEVQPKIAGYIGVASIDDLTFYDIDLQVDPDAGSFRAEEKLDFANRTGETLTSVALRVYGNQFGKEGEPAPVEFSSATIDGAPAGLEHPGPTTWEVKLPRPLAPGQRVTIVCSFTGQAPKQEQGQTGMLRQGMDMLKDLFGMGGGGIEGYGILSVGDGILSLAAWYPVLARWYPDEKQWDLSEPTGIGDVGTEDLANYRVRVRAPGEAVVASSGVEVAKGTTPTDVTYGGVALRDFTVLVSRSYHVVSRKSGEIKVSVYVPQGREPFAEKILDYALSAIEVYERRFGPYTLTELDVAAAPLIGGAGGVEFPGIVTVATMLMQDLSESLGALGSLAPAGLNRLPILDEMVEFVVVHEVAHQWWNGLIGSDSVRHPFIDEGMAQYSSILYFEDRYGSERATKTGDRNVKVNFLLYRMLGNPDGVVDRGTGDFSGALEYAALVYGKGPYYWQAVRRAIGDEKFGEVLKRYYDTYRYKVAASDAFAKLAGEVAGQPDEMMALYRRWLLETHGDEDLGKANFAQLMQMVLGDAEGLGGLAGLLGGGADGGAGADGGGANIGQLMGILQMLQGGAGADGGVAAGADGGGGPNIGQLMGLLQMLPGGAGADGGAGPGTPGMGDGAWLQQMMGLARGFLEPLAATNPDVARLLELMDKMQRGEPVDFAEAMALIQRVLGSLLGGDGAAQQIIGQALGTALGQPPAPAPRPSPDAGLP